MNRINFTNVEHENSFLARCQDLPDMYQHHHFSDLHISLCRVCRWDQKEIHTLCGLTPAHWLCKDGVFHGHLNPETYKSHVLSIKGFCGEGAYRISQVVRAGVHCNLNHANNGNCIFQCNRFISGV